MKEYQTENIRNVALVGHQSCGKTSLVEALLYSTGVTNRMGHISESNMVSDWMTRKRDAACRYLHLWCPWNLMISRSICWTRPVLPIFKVS